jgi:hypothetical protein
LEATDSATTPVPSRGDEVVLMALMTMDCMSPKSTFFSSYASTDMMTPLRLRSSSTILPPRYRKQLTFLICSQPHREAQNEVLTPFPTGRPARWKERGLF